jgi:hypothetical protein
MYVITLKFLPYFSLGLCPWSLKMSPTVGRLEVPLPPLEFAALCSRIVALAALIVSGVCSGQ